MTCMSSAEFFETWKLKLAQDFHKDGEPAKWGTGLDGPYLWDSEDSKATFDSEVRSIALSPDETQLVVAAGDMLYLHDASKLGHLRTLGGRTGKINSVNFSPDGQTLLTSSSIRRDARRTRGVLRLWKLDEVAIDNPSLSDITSQALESATQAATQAAISSLTGLAPQDGSIWNQEEADKNTAFVKKQILEALKESHTEIELERCGSFGGSLGSFDPAPFSRDSKRVLFSSAKEPIRDGPFIRSDRDITVMDVATKAPLFDLVGHTDAIMWVGESPDGALFATSSWDHTVRIWSAKDGTELHVFKESVHQNWAATFSPDSSIIAGGSGDSIVWMWDTKTGETLHKIEGFSGWIRTLQFSPDGKFLAAGSHGATLQVIEVATGEIVQQWKVDNTASQFSGSFLETHDVQWSKEGARLAFRTSEGRVMVYDFETNEKWDFEPDATRFKEGYWGSTLIMAKDGKTLWCAGKDGAVRKWSFGK